MKTWLYIIACWICQCILSNAQWKHLFSSGLQAFVKIKVHSAYTANPHRIAHALPNICSRKGTNPSLRPDPLDVERSQSFSISSRLSVRETICLDQCVFKSIRPRRRGVFAWEHQKTICPASADRYCYFNAIVCYGNSLIKSNYCRYRAQNGGNFGWYTGPHSRRVQVACSPEKRVSYDKVEDKLKQTVTHTTQKVPTMESSAAFEALYGVNVHWSQNWTPALNCLVNIFCKISLLTWDFSKRQFTKSWIFKFLCDVDILITQLDPGWRSFQASGEFRYLREIWQFTKCWTFKFLSNVNILIIQLYHGRRALQRIWSISIKILLLTWAAAQFTKSWTFKFVFFVHTL